MTRYVDQSLEQVRTALLEMAGRVEEMVADANRALVETMEKDAIRPWLRKAASCRVICHGRRSGMRLPW